MPRRRRRRRRRLPSKFFQCDQPNLTRIKIGYRGGLARLAQTHPSAPIVICGLKAGISKPGPTPRAPEAPTAPGVSGVLEVPGLSIASGASMLPGLPVSEVLRLPMTPGASRLPGVSEMSATLLMPSTLLVLRMGRTGPIPTIWAGGMKVLPRTLSHFSPTKLYEKQSITLTNLGTSEYFYFTEFRDSNDRLGVVRNNR